MNVLTVEPVSLAPGLHNVAVFPTTTLAGPFDLATRRQMEMAYGRLFENLVEAVSGVVAGHHGASASSLAPVVRRVAVPMAHYALDRILRVSRTLEIVNAPAALAAAEHAWTPTRAAPFANLALNSAVFNQASLCRFAPMWGLPLVTAGFSRELPANEYSRNNFNFSSRDIWQKVRRRLLRWLSRLKSGPIPTCGMGYDENALSENGFYLRYLNRQPAPALVDAQTNEGLRNGVRSAVAAVDLSEILPFAGPAGPPPREVSEALASWVTDLYPTEHLEGAQRNLERAVEQLAPCRGSSILIAGGPDEADVYLLAAARILNMSRIGWQHGVHYSFTDDMAVFQELEYAFLDEFISWGWTLPPQHPRVPALTITPLPSPWLTERGRRFAQLRRSSNGELEYDVLLMTDKLQRFPASSTGPGVVRNDALPAVAQSLRRFVLAADAEGLRVLHKPYNALARWMLADVIGELEVRAPARYTCLTRPDKGLTEELLSRCGVVVWDQPSTGFAECLVSGIPTLVWWPREYYQEAPRAASVFQELAQWGLVHASETSLVQTLQQVMHDRDGWMSEPGRRGAVARFCRSCAWTEDDWSAHWSRFLLARCSRAGR